MIGFREYINKAPQQSSSQCSIKQRSAQRGSAPASAAWMGPEHGAVADRCPSRLGSQRQHYAFHLQLYASRCRHPCSHRVFSGTRCTRWVPGRSRQTSLPAASPPGSCCLQCSDGWLPSGATRQSSRARAARTARRSRLRPSGQQQSSMESQCQSHSATTPTQIIVGNAAAEFAVLTKDDPSNPGHAALDLVGSLIDRTKRVATEALRTTQNTESLELVHPHYHRCRLYALIRQPHVRRLMQKGRPRLVSFFH